MPKIQWYSNPHCPNVCQAMGHLYLFKDKANIDEKVISGYFTKISHRNQPFIKIFLNMDLTHHFYTILSWVSSLVRFRERRYVPSYLPRHGRGFTLYFWPNSFGSYGSLRSLLQTTYSQMKNINSSFYPFLQQK